MKNETGKPDQRDEKIETLSREVTELRCHVMTLERECKRLQNLSDALVSIIVNELEKDPKELAVRFCESTLTESEESDSEK